MDKAASQESVILTVRGLNVYFDSQQVVFNVSLDIYDRSICAIIGPSGCGKTTILKAMNRLLEEDSNGSMVKVEGQVKYRGVDIYNELNVRERNDLRRKVTYILQNPHIFKMSIFENIARDVRFWKLASSKSELEAIVKQALERVGLWEAVSHRLTADAITLSAGQQQMLCIARALALRPEILLMDEPTAHIDPISLGKIEELLDELRSDFTFVIVTHNMQQAARVSQRVMYMYLGSAVEVAPTEDIFTSPADKRTQDYITGRYG